MKKKKSNQPEKCEAPGCLAPAVDGHEYCSAHSFIYGITSGLYKGADAWTKKRDPIKAAAGEIGKFFASKVKESIDDGTWQPIVNKAKVAVQAVKKSDPFEVLGLDSSATEKEIRERQRAFATILHSDKGANPSSENKLKEINAAASECIKSVNASKKS
jgi:hypothetical protein